MDNIYTDGQYLESTQTWHAEDAQWKAQQIQKILNQNNLKPGSVAEIGCGSGLILDTLSRQPGLQDTQFEGYDISPQAIEMANWLRNDRMNFYQEDLLSEDADSTLKCNG
ncbi:MAG: class I SAM-dependent methyltransferase [bacterium]